MKAVTEPTSWTEASHDDTAKTTHAHLPPTVVVGLGNDLLSDDGVGLYIARCLRDILDPACYQVVELSVGGMEIVEKMFGCRRAVVIDACCTGRHAPGTMTRHGPEEFSSSRRLGSFHTMNFATSLELARRLGADLPEQIDVFVIEAQDVTTVGERCTPAVATAIHPLAEAIARILMDDEAVGTGS